MLKITKKIVYKIINHAIAEYIYEGGKMKPKYEDVNIEDFFYDADDNMLNMALNASNNKLRNVMSDVFHKESYKENKKNQHEKDFQK